MRRRDRDAHADRERENYGANIQCDGPWPAADIERLNSRGHQSNRTRRHEAAEWKPEQSARKSEASGFADEGRENDATTCAEGAQDSNFRAAANDRNGNGVVNEKSADNERNVTQKAQVPTKPRKHAAILVRAAALRTNFYTGGQYGSQTLLPLLQPGTLRHFQNDTIQAAKTIQRTLRCGDVHHNCRFVPVRIGIHPSHCITTDLI